MLNLKKGTSFKTYRTSGHSSVVERLVANEKVEGSTPFARSKKKIMSDLANKKCIPCEGNIPPFNAEEIHKYLKKVAMDGHIGIMNLEIHLNQLMI